MKDQLIPISEGPLRDLRRGLFRSVPFALLGGFALFGDLPTGVVAITFCLGWVPLTLVEGWFARRPWTPIAAAVVVVLVWLLSAGALAGCSVQYEYVRGLSRGLPPGEALGTIAIPRRHWLDLAPVSAGLAVLLSAHLATRVVLAQGLEGSDAWASILQLTAAQAFTVGIFVAAFTTPAMFVLMLIVLAVTTALGLAITLPVTSGVDGIESLIWPPKRRPK